MTFRAAHSAKSVAAFFDLDGTLLPAPSLEWRFAAYLLAHDEIHMTQVARWFAHFAKFLLQNLQAATEANKAYLAGLRESLATDWANSLQSGSIPIFARGFHHVRWHLAQQHYVFFVSGTLEPLAHAVARIVSAAAASEATTGQSSAQIEICATEVDARDGRWTGSLSSEHRSGEAKASAVRALAVHHTLDLSRSFAYGNEIADLPMLAAVGNPCAVNPSARLERVARVRGWKICDWKEIVSTAPQAARAPIGTPILSSKGAQ
jgi:HAD superfamily phosphoserine phosphatase-like hydrolase